MNKKSFLIPAILFLTQATILPNDAASAINYPLNVYSKVRAQDSVLCEQYSVFNCGLYLYRLDAIQWLPEDRVTEAFNRQFPMPGIARFDLSYKEFKNRGWDPILRLLRRR